MPKSQFSDFFGKPVSCGQTVLPDSSFLIGQKLLENAKIRKFQCDIFSNFLAPLKVFLVVARFARSLIFFGQKQTVLEQCVFASRAPPSPPPKPRFLLRLWPRPLPITWWTDAFFKGKRRQRKMKEENMLRFLLILVKIKQLKLSKSLEIKKTPIYFKL